MRSVLATALVCLSLLAGCSSDESAQPAPPVTLRLGHVGHDHQLALYVAALRPDLLSENAPKLRQVKPREVYDLISNGRPVARLILHKVGGGARMTTAIAADTIDVGLGGVAAAAKAREKGLPVKIIAPLQTDGDFLAVRADSPLSSWEDFAKAARRDERPLVIGYKAPVAVAKLVFAGALEAENISWSDQAQPGAQVHLRNLMREASPIVLLETGEIDGIVWNQPAIAVAQAKGVARPICQLRDLPPSGKWTDHPCCAVVATQAVIDAHPDELTELLKVFILATREIQADPAMAAAVAAEWTGTREEIEAASVPTITYLAEPSESWRGGLLTWHGLMRQVGGFTGRYKETSAEAFADDLADLRLIGAAAEQLRAAGLLESAAP
ncbi:MAG: ABC transporter substrate-binding protein [Phycisphaerae bacterium]